MWTSDASGGSVYAKITFSGWNATLASGRYMRRHILTSQDKGRDKSQPADRRHDQDQIPGKTVQHSADKRLKESLSAFPLLKKAAKRWNQGWLAGPLVESTGFR